MRKGARREGNERCEADACKLQCIGHHRDHDRNHRIRLSIEDSDKTFRSQKGPSALVKAVKSATLP